MNQYIITEENLQEVFEHADWGMTNFQKFKDKLRPYNPQAEQKPDLSHITPERRGCLTCLAPDCPIWQAADQNCWKPQAEQVGTDGLTDSEYEHTKLVQEIEILNDRLQAERERALGEVLTRTIQLHESFVCPHLNSLCPEGKICELCMIEAVVKELREGKEGE